jgi:hypothetical protein
MEVTLIQLRNFYSWRACLVDMQDPYNTSFLANSTFAMVVKFPGPAKDKLLLANILKGFLEFRSYFQQSSI